MGKSKIEWTDETWNPVTGCTKVSPGCKNCYAERQWKRLSAPGQPYDGRAFTDVQVHPERLEKPLHWWKPRMVFVNSMSDLFHPDVPFPFIAEVFDTMASSLLYLDAIVHHTFQVLTKRPQRMLDFLDWAQHHHYTWGSEVPSNIWLGVSCEDHETAVKRIPPLLRSPAKVRFVSLEPLLEPINLLYLDVKAGGDPDWRQIDALSGVHFDVGRSCGMVPRLQWVIVGGESGPKARHMALEWAINIRDQCLVSGTPFFMKQGSQDWGSSFKRMELWPEALQVREYPQL